MCSLHAASGLHAVVLPSNTVLCLLDGQPAASCSIRYGADPTYRVLPNTDSAVTGGVITLTSTLTGDTTYYIVSTTTGSLNMERRGSFTTCTTQDLMAPNTIVQPQSSCGEPSGNAHLACYSGVTPGSTVTYRYAPGSSVSQSTRRCQSDGNWSGTSPNSGELSHSAVCHMVHWYSTPLNCPIEHLSSGVRWICKTSFRVQWNVLVQNDHIT